MTFSKSDASHSDFDYLKFVLQLNGKFSTLFARSSKSVFPDVMDPFVYSGSIPWCDWLKMAILTIVLMPFRIIGFLVVFGMCFLISMTALAGQTAEDAKRPMTGWRK